MQCVYTLQNVTDGCRNTNANESPALFAYLPIIKSHWKRPNKYIDRHININYNEGKQMIQ